MYNSPTVSEYTNTNFLIKKKFVDSPEKIVYVPNFKQTCEKSTLKPQLIQKHWLKRSHVWKMPFQSFIEWMSVAAEASSPQMIPV